MVAGWKGRYDREEIRQGRDTAGRGYGRGGAIWKGHDGRRLEGTKKIP